MEFIDLGRQQQRIRADIDRRISAVMAHGRYIMGPEVAELEQRLAAFTGVEHCIGVASGTDALLIAMMALGIGPGDEVITTAFSFIATGETIVLLGATPVFADIDPVTWNLDPAGIEACITPRTRAIIPVSLYGQCADMDAINAIADRHRLAVIEDAAQSLGATYKGRQSCGLSTIGCTSFFPTKPLGAYGDGGACFTSDAALAKVMREIRVHGQDRRYHHARVGINGRIDTLQAAILLAKLEVFADEVERRAQVGARYSEQLNGIVQAPRIMEYNTSVYSQYTIEVDRREQVQEGLHAAGIPTAVHYPLPLNNQPALSRYCQQDRDLPHTQRAAQRVMSLPMHPYLEEAEQDTVVAALARLVG
jgi:UDP-2-acetamido-2-deoxy-ribo-hexuluronate aminotransferase